MSPELENEPLILSAEQQNEILRREKEFEEDRTSARSWEDIKKDLQSIYN